MICFTVLETLSLICENLRQLKRLMGIYKQGIQGLEALTKLENLEELILTNGSLGEKGDEEMTNLHQNFYKILPKLKTFGTNGFHNNYSFYESIVVDCKNITPCALETCYTNFENAKDV